MNVSTEALLLLVQVFALYGLPPLLVAGRITAGPASCRRPGGKQRGRAAPKKPTTLSPCEVEGSVGKGPKQLCSAVTSQINGGKRFVPVCAGTCGWICVVVETERVSLSSCHHCLPSHANKKMK